MKPESFREVYDKPEAVRLYSHHGLWPVERFLCNSYLCQPGTVLDVACAAGRVAIPLASNSNFKVIGFDISLNQVRKALQKAREENLNCYFLQCDMMALGLATESVDYIFITYTSLGALTTFEARHYALKEISRVLKPNGLAFISIWNRLWPGSWGIAWMKWILLWLLRILKHNQNAPGNRVCWEEGGYVLWHYFWPWEILSLAKEVDFQILSIIPFTKSWHENQILNNTMWSRWLGEGLYFVLTKSK